MPQDTAAGALPPHNSEAEQSVLGAMLQSAHAVSTAAELLSREDFYQPVHQEIFDAIRSVSARGEPVDLITADAELARRGMLEGIGGTEYLITLIRYVPTAANIKAYARIVAEKSILRKLIRAADVIREQCYTQQLPLEDILGGAEKSIFDIAMKRTGGNQLIHIKDVLQLTYEQIEEYARLKGQYAGITTGFTDLDDLLTGLHAGELVLIGARPSMGKTSIAMNICQYAAMFKKTKTAVFSLEMPREQIAMRMLCSIARVDMHRVRAGRIQDSEWVKLAGALSALAQSPMYIDDTPGIKPSQVRSRCRRLMMESGLDLILVDYMQLMSADKRTENRQLEVSEISRQLKSIAMELKVPLIACAQLSRAAATRNDKRPVLSDLRDSGSIEQDADVVMFLHRESYYDPSNQDHNLAEIIIAKQRNGPLGTVSLAWLEEYLTFTGLSTATENMNRERTQ